MYSLKCHPNVFVIVSQTLTHWGRVTHICVCKLTTTGSDNGLSPDRCQAIIWTNAGILLIGPLGTNFSEILVKFLIFSFKKMSLKVSSAKWRPFCLGLNVLSHHGFVQWLGNDQAIIWINNDHMVLHQVTGPQWVNIFKIITERLYWENDPFSTWW